MQQINDRAIALIVKGTKILIMWRFYDNEEYNSMIGGTQEEGENIEDTFVREVMEEVNLKVNKFEKIYEWTHKYKDNGKNFERKEHYFLTTDFEGEVKLGEPEISRTSRTNIYKPMWVELDVMEHEAKWEPQEIFPIIRERVKI